ncbi:MAG: glycosyltransferase [Bryobacteraceae bacterium]
MPADRGVWQEARALTEAGYRVSVICPKSRGFETSYERIQDIEVYRYRSFEGFGPIRYVLEYGWALVNQFRLAVRIFRKTRFRILQGCNPPDTIFLIALVFKLLGVRYIFDQHDPAPQLCLHKFPQNHLFFRMSLWAERLSFRTADTVIVTNDSAKKNAIELGNVSPERVFVVRGCPDLADFQLPEPSPELKEGRKNLVVYLGVMGSQDGVDLLIDSIEYLVKTNGREDALFALIGFGSELPRLQGLVASKGLEPWVRFTGALYGDKLRPYLATADVGVSPDPSNGFNDRLTMLKTLEYMACGLPTVLFDLNEGRITAADAALYAHPNDTKSFGDQIIRLLDNEQLRLELGARGKQRAYQTLNWQAQKQNLYDAYDFALSGAKGHVTHLEPPESASVPTGQMLLTRIYYSVKPFVPWAVRLRVRRRWARHRRKACAAVWPIDQTAGFTPPDWPGWPESKQFALVLTHDVEGRKGLSRVRQLMDLEARYGLRSSFNFVPEGEYDLPDSTREMLDMAGFEVGVHGLEHDGKLYSSKKAFASKAARIQMYLKRWNASGFRSPLMQHRLSWLHQLSAEYDASTFDTDPFEPEPDGVGTVFPFWAKGSGKTGYVELPYTLAQDFSLFVVLEEPNIDVWKQKLDWVAEHGGMALLDTHPDYMCFEGKPGRDEYPASHYEEFLRYALAKYEGRFWPALARDVARFYRANVPPDKRNSRRKVCMLAHSTYESDNRVRRYAEALVKRGDRVDVISICGHPSQIGMTVIGGVNVHQIQHRERNERHKWTYAYRLLRFFIGASIQLTRMHHRIRYDLIHVHNVPDFLVFAALYPKWTGAKLILDIHDLVPELFASKFGPNPRGHYVRILKLIEKASAAFVDKVIVSNHLWYEKIVSRSVSRDKCSVFVNHVDAGVFNRRTRTRDYGKTVILFPGSLQRHQGVDIAIKAFALVKDRMPNAEFQIYSDGSRAKDELSKLAATLGVGESVKWYAAVPIDEIADVIANADLGVVPKRADSFGNEAYSTKIMEFMSQGVPVVASRTKIDSFYFDESVVHFFDSGDHRAMADAMLEVLESKPLRDSLISRGLEYAENHGWNRKRHEYFELVDSIVLEQFASGSAPVTAAKEV